MYHLQETKKVVLEPTSVTNGGTAAFTIDTRDFGAASIDVVISRSNNATNVPTVFSLSTADVTNTSSFVAISGATFTSTYTTASTTAADTLTWDIALNASQKRYLRVAVSPVTTQTIAGVANLYRGKLAPATATDKNVTGWIQL